MCRTPFPVIRSLELLRPDQRNDQVQHHDRGNDGKNHVFHATYTRSKAKMVTRSNPNSAMLNTTNATSPIA
jgi:hypothetical protein